MRGHPRKLQEGFRAQESRAPPNFHKANSRLVPGYGALREDAAFSPKGARPDEFPKSHSHEGVLALFTADQ